MTPILPLKIPDWFTMQWLHPKSSLITLIAMSLLVRLLVGCDDGSTVVPEPTRAGDTLTRPGNSGNAGLGDPLVVEGELRLEPRVLEVTGVSQCEDLPVRTITLHNDGDVEETIDRVISSCGCVVIQVEPGTTVAPGRSIEIPIIFKAWGGSRRKTYDARFILAGDRLGPLLSMDVTVSSPLRSIPSAAQQAIHPEGRVRILSVDGEPFSVVGLDPPIPATVSPGPASEITIVIDWSALGPWLESNRSAVGPDLRHAEDGTWDRLRLQVLTDRPDCARFTLELFGARHTSPVWTVGSPVP